MTPRRPVRWPRAALMRVLVAAMLLASTGACAYYNTFYLARKYYLKATNGAPYEVDREGSTQRQNYSKSGDYSKKLLGVYPKSKWVDDAWLLWARAFIGTDDPLKAVAMLQEFQERFPKSELRPDAAFFLGLAYRSARKYEQSVETFDEFLSQAPKHELVPYAYYERSRALLSLRRYAEAANSAGEILSRYPRHLLVDRALRQRAEARFQQKDWAGARADFRAMGNRALTDDERLQFLLREVDCLEADRGYDEARSLLSDARSHVPPPPPVPQALRAGTNTAGMTPQQIQQLQQQQQQFQNQQLAPGTDKYGRLTLRMGGVELLAGRVEQAIESFRAVISDYPRTSLAAEAQFRIGYAYETGADDFGKARAEYLKVKEQTGTSQFSQQAQQRLDNLERIERFRSASGVDSLARKAEARFLTAEHYLFNLDRPERALEEYRAIADSAKGTAVAARALNAQAWVLSRKLDRRPEADSLFWKVVREYPATEAQLAARDYLEAEGIPVPEKLIVAPKLPAAPVLEEETELSEPPAGSQKLGTRGGVFEPAAVRYGPGVNAPSSPGLPPSAARYSGLPDSLRRMMVLRDSLLRIARTDTTATGRARLDSLRRSLARPDTVGRGALMAEIQRQIAKPEGVVVAPDSTPPNLSAPDTLQAEAPAHVTPAAAAPRDSMRTPVKAAAKRDSSRAAPAVAKRDTAAARLRLSPAQRDSLKRVRAREDSLARARAVRDSLRAQAESGVALRERLKKYDPLRIEAARRDSLRRAKAVADSLKKLSPAAPKRRTGAAADSLKRKQARADSIAAIYRAAAKASAQRAAGAPDTTKAKQP